MTDMLVAPNAETELDTATNPDQPEDEGLSGAQKAAIVLLKLGPERASEILKLLGEREVTEVTAEIVNAQSVKREDAEASIREFAAMAKANDHLATGGIDRAREMLEAAVGPNRTSIILDSLQVAIAEQPFEFLRKIEPRQVVNFLSGEHPQTVALVLAHLPPEQASNILGRFDEGMQQDVSIRVAKLERTSPAVVSRMEALLEERFGSARSSRATLDQADGVQTLIEILNRSDRNTEQAIFEALEEHESLLAENVRARMFVFEDITTLEDKAIQLLLREVDARDLATALKGVRRDVRDKVMSNMSERAGKNLEEEIELLGSVRMSTVQEAQATIVSRIRHLEESGQIIVSRGSEEFVE